MKEKTGEHKYLIFKQEGIGEKMTFCPSKTAEKGGWNIWHCRNRESWN